MIRTVLKNQQKSQKWLPSEWRETNRTIFCSKSHLLSQPMRMGQWNKTTNQILRLFLTNHSHCRKIKDKKNRVKRRQNSHHVYPRLKWEVQLSSLMIWALNSRWSGLGSSLIRDVALCGLHVLLGQSWSRAVPLDKGNEGSGSESTSKLNVTR